MKLKNLKTRLVKLPTNIELTLYLIKQDLKSTKLSNGLAAIGFTDSFFETYYSTFVISYMGFEENDDAIHQLYIKLLDKYSNKLDSSNESLMKYTMKIYVALQIAKKSKTKLKVLN
jgi:hypothetical protein